jgi:hypothetical protein
LKLILLSLSAAMLFLGFLLPLVLLLLLLLILLPTFLSLLSFFACPAYLGLSLVDTW